jgi:hypothetical protein
LQIGLEGVDVLFELLLLRLYFIEIAFQGLDLGLGLEECVVLRGITSAWTTLIFQNELLPLRLGEEASSHHCDG